MRRLNRKGFTLVELLAVIVILAIVVGITMVTVLPTLKNARQEAFELTAQTAADFIEKQYQLYLIGETGTILEEMLDKFNSLTYTDGKSNEVKFTENMITSAGLKKENYVLENICIDIDLVGSGDESCRYSKWHINKNTGRACVFLLAASQELKKWSGGNGYYQNIQEGEYYDVSPPYTYTSECLNGYFE